MVVPSQGSVEEQREENFLTLIVSFWKQLVRHATVVERITFWNVIRSWKDLSLKDFSEVVETARRGQLSSEITSNVDP